MTINQREKVIISYGVKETDAMDREREGEKKEDESKSSSFSK